MADISKIIGVDIATIAKINNIAIGGIGSVNGSIIPTESFWDTFSGDDFTGTNGDPLDISVWVDQGASADWEIQGNKAYINIGASKEAISTSLFRMSGDFDVQISFDSVSIGTVGLIRLLAFNEDASYGAFIGAEKVGTDLISGSFRTASVFDGATSIGRSNNYGQLRIYRDGNVWYNQYKDGAGALTTLVSKDQSNSDNVAIKFLATTQASSSISGNLDDFIINSGTVIPPV